MYVDMFVLHVLYMISVIIRTRVVFMSLFVSCFESIFVYYALSLLPFQQTLSTLIYIVVGPIKLAKNKGAAIRPSLCSVESRVPVQSD